MSYDHKIVDQKYHLKGLVNPDVCNQLIKFYEDNKNLSLPEGSYKFGDNIEKNKREVDNCNFLNLSKNTHREGFKDTFNLILRSIIYFDINTKNNLQDKYKKRNTREQQITRQTHSPLSDRNQVGRYLRCPCACASARRGVNRP